MKILISNNKSFDKTLDKILEKKGTEAPSNSANFQDERGVFLIHNQFIDPKDKLVPTAFIDDEL